MSEENLFRLDTEELAELPPMVRIEQRIQYAEQQLSAEIEAVEEMLEKHAELLGELGQGVNEMRVEFAAATTSNAVLLDLLRVQLKNNQEEIRADRKRGDLTLAALSLFVLLLLVAVTGVGMTLAGPDGTGSLGLTPRGSHHAPE